MLQKEIIWNKINKLAAKATLKGEIPIGAIVLDSENKIISQAFNKNNKTSKISDHAEIIALSKAGKKLKTWKMNDCTLMITLEPCLMCFGAIINSRIKNVYFMLKANKGISSHKMFNSLESKMHLKEFKQIKTTEAIVAQKNISNFFNGLRNGRS